MNNLLRHVKSCSDNIVLSLNTTLNMEREKIYNNKEKIRSILESNLLLFSEVAEAEIVMNSSERYAKIKNGHFYSENNIMNLCEYYQQLSCGIKGKWYCLSDGSGRFCYIRELCESNTIRQVGYIILYVNEETLYNYYKNEKNATDMDIYIFNQESCLVSTNDRVLMENMETSSEYNTDKKLLHEYEVDRCYSVFEYPLEYGWTFSSVLDIRQGMSGFNAFTMGVLWSSMLFMALFSGIVIFILHRIMISIRMLSRHMVTEGMDTGKKIKEPQTKDEVGSLISNYNIMIDRNKELIDCIKSEENMKRRLELALLQAQIKPHFLYNTLDTAFCLIKMQRTYEASYVIKELAGYYRLVLSHGNEWINLREELNAAERYMNIQAVRFGEIISYKIEVEEELYNFKVPKMILQPLIENSIYHGIKPANRKGTIVIGGEQLNQQIRITVSDDGVGMDREYFDRIMKAECTEEQHANFGVRSTAERIKLYYGNTAKLILNTPFEGTSLTIEVNLEKQE